MLKRPPYLLEPDPRCETLIGSVSDNGNLRAMSINDLYDLVSEIELNAAIPEKIVDQFDKARHALIYSWFAYDLVSLAEQQGYQVVELALRYKLSPDELTRASKERWGMKRLVDYAVAKNWLSRKEFEVPAPWAPGETASALDMFMRARNQLAHGSYNLFPSGSFTMLKLPADILNALFRSQGSV